MRADLRWSRKEHGAKYQPNEATVRDSIETRLACNDVAAYRFSAMPSLETELDRPRRLAQTARMTRTFWFRARQLLIPMMAGVVTSLVGCGSNNDEARVQTGGAPAGGDSQVGTSSGGNSDQGGLSSDNGGRSANGGSAGLSGATAGAGRATSNGGGGVATGGQQGSLGAALGENCMASGCSVWPCVTSTTDCASRTCVFETRYLPDLTYCTSSCGSVGADCPVGYDCLPDAENAAKSWCIKQAPTPPADFGVACDNSFNRSNCNAVDDTLDCAEKGNGCKEWCVRGEGASSAHCSTPCSETLPCPTGYVCRDNPEGSTGASVCF